MTLNLVTPHLAGNIVLFYRKHSSEATAFVRTLRLYDFYTLYQRQQIAQLIIIRNIQGEEIGKVNTNDNESSIQNLVKNNSSRFSKKKVYLKKEQEKLVVEKIEDI